MTTSFATVLTPLTAIPIVLGFVIGAWGCFTIIAAYHGLDLTVAVPWIHIEQGKGFAAPLVLLIVAGFAIARGRLTSWRRFWARASLAGVALAFAATPYWLQTPLPWLAAIAGIVLVWFGWRQITRNRAL